jgi:AmmeMemoRadiSam system protein A
MRKMDYSGLYYALRDGQAQACGGFATVIALKIAQGLGYSELEVLNSTNSARVTSKLVKGEWTVGYASCAIFGQKGAKMLNIQQKQKLLKIARASISTYLKSGEKLKINEHEPGLSQKNGAFVTLNQRNALRGCIGNLIGSQPLYLTVRDMAIAAAVDDPRFSALNLEELKDVEIEISVLSELKKVFSAEEIELGKHGVLVRLGNRNGVFLPQVATETGWSKEEFLNNLCAQKAGIAANAWQDKATELYIFTAEVFSEREVET